MALMTASSRARDSPVCKSTSESGVPHVVKIDLCTATRPVGYLEVRFFRSRSAHVVVPRSTLTHLQRSMRGRSSTERASPRLLSLRTEPFCLVVGVRRMTVALCATHGQANSTRLSKLGVQRLPCLSSTTGLLGLFGRQFCCLPCPRDLLCDVTCYNQLSHQYKFVGANKHVAVVQTGVA